MCSYIKRGSFTLEDEKLIIQLHGILGNRYLIMLTKSETQNFNIALVNDGKIYFNS